MKIVDVFGCFGNLNGVFMVVWVCFGEINGIELQIIGLKEVYFWSNINIQLPAALLSRFDLLFVLVGTKCFV